MDNFQRSTGLLCPLVIKSLLKKRAKATLYKGDYFTAVTRALTSQR
jgi:hypothetical protein